MNDVLLFLTIAGGFALTLAFIFAVIGWYVHKCQSIEHNQTWDYGNFDDFREEYAKIKWLKRDDLYPSSVFHPASNSQVHSGNISFNGKGMVLNPIAYVRMVQFMRVDKKARHAPGTWKSRRHLKVVK